MWERDWKIRARQALSEAFTLQELDMLVSDSCGKRLAKVVATSHGLDYAVHELIDWAERTGQLASLMEAVRAERSSVPELCELADELAARAADVRTERRPKRMEVPTPAESDSAPPSTLTPATQLTSDDGRLALVLDALRSGSKIGAIRSYREHFGVSLQEAKLRVEELARSTPAPATQAPTTSTDGVMEGVVEMLGRGERLNAIRLYAARVGCGLAAAKDAIDALDATTPAQPEPEGPGHGLYRVEALGVVPARTSLYLFADSSFAFTNDLGLARVQAMGRWDRVEPAEAPSAMRILRAREMSERTLATCVLRLAGTVRTVFPTGLTTSPGPFLLVAYLRRCAERRWEGVDGQGNSIAFVAT